MKRTELNEKIKANNEKIKQLRLENYELQKQEMLISDDEQQYYEEMVDVVIKKRPKQVEKQLHGIITWNENFKDGSDGSIITIRRSKVVRINGEWVF